jgi:AraC family transcriptional regulator
VLDRGWASGSTWHGARLRETTLAPWDLGPCQLRWNVITLNVGEPVIIDHAFAGEARRVMRVEPGAACVLPAGVPFVSRCNEPYHLAILAISPGRLHEAAARRPGGGTALLPARGVHDPVLGALLRALCGQLRSGSAGGAHARWLLDTLLTWLLHEHGTTAAAYADPWAAGGLSAATARRVTAYVDAHLDDPGLTVRALATVAGLSAFHFQRCFKQTLGTSPHAYVLERRIARSKGLLTTTEASIGDVSARCGFADQSSFARAFHRITGLTPRAWRKRA